MDHLAQTTTRASVQEFLEFSEPKKMVPLLLEEQAAGRFSFGFAKFIFLQDVCFRVNGLFFGREILSYGGLYYLHFFLTVKFLFGKFPSRQQLVLLKKYTNRKHSYAYLAAEAEEPLLQSYLVMTQTA